MNKELLHAGYWLHLVFDEMVQDIRKDPDNWIMIIEKNIDQISSLISEHSGGARSGQRRGVSGIGLYGPGCPPLGYVRPGDGSGPYPRQYQGPPVPGGVGGRSEERRVGKECGS